MSLPKKTRKVFGRENHMDSSSTSPEFKQSDIKLRADTCACPIELLPQLIRKRAYELFEARGCQPGRELEDWLQAELEIKHRSNL
jgi:hypothetical protein